MVTHPPSINHRIHNSPSAGASALQRIAELRGGASSAGASISAPIPCVADSLYMPVNRRQFTNTAAAIHTTYHDRRQR